ncbi:MAG TPA: DUF5060 domain-containing protein [Acidobacteriota bacterium]|nr:DUF5060 domain-containing protein [Acidobacteriota bacterium]
MRRITGFLLFCSLIAIPAHAQRRFQGEGILRLFDPSLSVWEVSFERDATGLPRPLRAEFRRAAQGVFMRLPEESPVAAGLGAVHGHFDLSRYEEIHLWIRANATVLVQPYSQTSGFIFRDGGDPDTAVPGDGRIVRLRIRRDSMTDPSMVESIGIQVRPGAAGGTVLRLLAVTAVPRTPASISPVFAITGVSAPPTAARNAMFTIDFDLSRSYDNQFDPDQIDVQAHFNTPSGREIVIPAFWFQDYTVAPNTQTYEQYLPAGTARWRVRFLPLEEGRYSVSLTARDKDGNIDNAGPFNFIASASQNPGPVRRHPSNPFVLQFANRAPYIPMGHNLGFEDGNPALNGTAYYRSLLTSFGSSGENWTRFWMTDFSRTALEWSLGHWSGFYEGVGIYSQRAAWRVDQFFEIALTNGVQVQLVINDHGQFSTYANQRWDGSQTDTGNPYNSTYGGPVPQANPEQFFSNTTARSLFRRRLRYLVARWSAYPNLLAWELFNEVQWAGTPTKNFRTDYATQSVIISWHQEMADFLKGLDPFNHLVTTSSDDDLGTGFGQIWNLASIDLVQSHHYYPPPIPPRDALIHGYVVRAQQAYNKPVIVGEMGVKADSVPECDFDPEGFLTNTSVPASERTAANRDHLVAGTTLRNGMWSAALSQSGAMNWWWGCYIADDPGRRRLAPDFPLNARLFPPLVSFWGGEEPAADGLNDASLQSAGQVLAYGLQSTSKAFAWVRDTRNAYMSGFGPATMESRSTDNASVTFSGLEPGAYVLSLYSSYGNGDLMAQSDVAAPNGTLSVTLPSFQGDIAFKVNRGMESTWGAVPRSAKAWIVGDDSGDVRVLYSFLRSTPGFSDGLGGAVLTISDGQSAASELTVPALGLSANFWTIAEISAPSHTGLALVNPASVSTNVLLILYRDNGEQAATHALALAPGEHVAKFLVEPDWFGQTLAPFRGTLAVRSDQPICALALRGTHNAQGQFIMTSIPAGSDEFPQSAEVLPQVADGGGYQTELLMLNSSDAPLTGRLTFRKSDGSAWLLAIQGTPVSELRYNIPVHGMIRWTTGAAGSDVAVGYCLLAPDPGQAPPAGGAVIRYLPGGALRSETGLPFLPLSTSAGSYWETGPDLDTGIALVNSVAQDQQVRLRLFLRDGGEQIRETQVTLTSGGHLARFVSELFPGLPSGSRGYLSVGADSPCGFLPLRMKTTPQGVLFSSLLLSRLTGGVDRILPQVVSGGGYRTQFIVVNPGDLTSSGKIRYFDDRGNPARLLLRSP